MKSRADRLARLALLAAALALACCAAGGCGEPTARLWADAATPDGTMSLQKHQWAYDGETVTFELDCQPGTVQYVVFGIEGEETVIDIPKVLGKYRWTHVFAAGAKPKDYEVYAKPFLIRDHRDYIYDKLEGKWYYYPSHNDKPDVQTAPEQTILITCYRVELREKLKALAGPPQKVALTLVKDDDKRIVIPQRQPSATEAPGFLLLGPDADGAYEVVYTPRYDEVNRAGTTRVELDAYYADGAMRRVAHDFRTP